MIELYRNGTSILKVRPDDGDECVKEVMGENTLTLTVRRTSPFAFAIGDYAYFAAERYTINQLPSVHKEDGVLVYDITMEGVEYELRKAHMLYYTANLNYVGGAEFSLMGNAELHARVIVENLNRVQGGWTLGEVVGSAAKNLTYSGNNCLEAITQIAEAFATEYWIGADKTVNIGVRGSTMPVTLQYGKGKGLYSIERKNVSSKDVVTRLYPFGSSQNLPKGYRSNASNLQIEGAYIESNVNIYGVIEGSQTFDEIKPERTGTVTAVDAANVLKFSDNGMDFDLNARDTDGNTTVLIPGTSAKIHFQTGDLAGYEFEIAAYSHADKAFTLVLFTDEKAYNLPNTTLKPRVGDRYIILDIYMPATYVADAETRLLAKAQESLAQNSVPNVAYDVELDPLYVARMGITLVPGDSIHVTDPDIGMDRDIRIKRVARKLVNTNHYGLELTDTVEPTLVSQIITTLEQTTNIIKLNRLNDPARARRSYKVVQELQNAIFDQDGYFDPTNIKPFSIETSMLSVGSKGQQFITDCLFQANYQGEKNSIRISDGVLTHFTIADTPRTWDDISGLATTLPDDNLRYIYIMCQREGPEGWVVLKDTRLSVDSDPGVYYFLAGVLSSVIDGARQVSLTFGFTTINGRFIKTGRVQSADGLTYFDLDSGEIGGKIKFLRGGVLHDVGAMAVGGRNLVRNSKVNESGDTMGFAIRSAVVEAGQEYTLSANGRCNDVTEGCMLRVDIYTQDWVWYDSLVISAIVDTTESLTFTSEITGTLYIRAGYFPDTEPKDGTVTVNWYKLERGNMATDWTPATEDVDASIETSTATTIEGGLVTSGTIQVGEGGSGSVTVKAGMTGQGSDEGSVRFWAGSTYASRANAPFRVMQNGSASIAGWSMDPERIYQLNGTEEVELNSYTRKLSFTVDGLEKVGISGSGLPALSELVSPQSGTVYPGSNSPHTGPGFFTFLAPNSFTIPYSAIRLRTKFSYDGQVCGIKVSAYLATVEGVKVRLLKSMEGVIPGDPYGEEYLLWNFSKEVAAGTYKILYEYEITPDWVEMNFKLEVLELIYSMARTGSIIGNNGIAVFGSTARYFYMNTGSTPFAEARGRLKWATEGNANQYLYIGYSSIELGGLPTRSSQTVYRLYVDGNGTIYKRATAGE